MSPEQSVTYVSSRSEKTKRTSIDFFIEQIGDIPLTEITRDVATK